MIKNKEIQVVYPENCSDELLNFINERVSYLQSQDNNMEYCPTHGHQQFITVTEVVNDDENVSICCPICNKINNFSQS